MWSVQEVQKYCNDEYGGVLPTVILDQRVSLVQKSEAGVCRRFIGTGLAEISGGGIIATASNSLP